MNDISELLLGPQRSAGTTFEIILAAIGISLAIALMIYLLRCYVQESLLRKRVKRRVHQSCGGNIVAGGAIRDVDACSKTGRLTKKLSGLLPAAHRSNGRIKAPRRGIHPWKQQRLSDAPRPH
jgi:hypothetical protein